MSIHFLSIYSAGSGGYGTPSVGAGVKLPRPVCQALLCAQVDICVEYGPGGDPFPSYLPDLRPHQAGSFITQVSVGGVSTLLSLPPNACNTGRVSHVLSCNLEVSTAEYPWGVTWGSHRLTRPAGCPLTW